MIRPVPDTRNKEETMPYELLEKEIKSLTNPQQEAVILFVHFLASQDASRIATHGPYEFPS